MRRALISLSILVAGMGALAILKPFFPTPTTLGPERLKKGREAEAALISHSAASGLASFKFLERSFDDVGTHYCVLSGAGDSQIVNDYARQNRLRVRLDDSFVSPDEYWSVILLNNDDSWTILMANECVTLTGNGGRCAPISASVLKMTPAGQSDTCPNGRFSIGLED